MNISEKIRFVDDRIGFYFDGDFSSVISEGGIDEEELDNWYRIAFIYSHCLDRLGESAKNLSEYEMLTLAEDICSTAEVAAITGDEPDYEDIGLGYGFDLDKYKVFIDSAVEVIQANDGLFSDLR